MFSHIGCAHMGDSPSLQVSWTQFSTYQAAEGMRTRFHDLFKLRFIALLICGVWIVFRKAIHALGIELENPSGLRFPENHFEGFPELASAVELDLHPELVPSLCGYLRFRLAMGRFEHKSQKKF